jgi:hypothetical protein
MSQKYAFVMPMLAAVVRNRLHGLRIVKGNALELDGLEGRKIGESLARSLAVNTQATAAVDAYIGNFPALEELDEEYDWFRPMLEAISYRLLEEVPWGLKMRVTVGAITSMADLLTDIYVTYMFLRDGKGGYFKASLASLITSLGIQMLFVWGQNRKLGSTRVLKEWFPILIGFKPAVDAYRVAKGEKQEAGHAVDPLFEMTVMKGIEMFAEAVPGVIIQLMAIVTSEGVTSRAAWVSLTVSALTTGFASATISYDYDTNPMRREQVPDFYGYIPAKASKRALVFVSMVLLTAGMLLIRCMTIVVLGLFGGRWVALYIGGDLVLYLVVKILRGDFWYWIPAGGKVEILSSIVARVLVKVVTDFTSIVQFRHPYEVGGFYWMFGFLLTMGSLPTATIIAESNVQESQGILLARAVTTYFIPVTLLCFAIFLLNIERKYLGTFFSFERGKEYTVTIFKEGKDDTTKAFAAFTNSKHHWISIEEEIRVWVEANWARWEEEKPKWFDEGMRESIPVEYIPTAAGRDKERGRRASVVAEAEGGAGGAVRESLRRASQGTLLRGDARVKPIQEEDN